MRFPNVPVRAVWLAMSLVVVFELAACRSSSTTVMAPSDSKCQIVVTNNTPEVSAAGGNGSLAVSTSRDCTWSALTEAAWIALSASSGQGAATVNYSVSPNPDGTRRQGRIVVAEQPIDVVQAAAPCRYQLSPSLMNVGADGGQISVALMAANGCGWRVGSDASWVGAAVPVEGAGPATIRLTVAANSGSARSAIVTIVDAILRVNQAAAGAPAEPPPAPTPAPTPTPSPPCTYAIRPASYHAGRGRDDVRVDVTAPAGCSWTASTGAAWVTVDAGRNGSGTGTVRLLVESNTGAARTAIVMIATQTSTLQQEGVCNYSIKPKNYHAGRGPDDVRVEVTTDAGCTWTASSSASWVSVVEGQSGSGSGLVRLLVQPNSGPDRTTTLTIAGQPFELRQNGSN